MLRYLDSELLEPNSQANVELASRQRHNHTVEEG